MAIFAHSDDPIQGVIFCRRGTGQAPAQSAVRVLAESGGYKVLTPFNRNFVDALKFEIPSTGRKWEPSSKCWYVSESFGPKLKELIDQHYGTDVQLPNILGATPQIFEVTFQADYVANCKQGNGIDTSAASVHCRGGWNARIPEKVLRTWFKQAAAAEAANAPQTFYAMLGCDESASELEIKKAFKRAARQWHPDLCKEPEARDMFEKIKAASEVLLDVVQRAKYNAGLMFEKMAKSPGQKRRVSQYASFTPLLRCGMLTVRGKTELGMLIVEEILAWEDIENEFGQTMVSFWAGDNFSVMWV